MFKMLSNTINFLLLIDYDTFYNKGVINTVGKNIE